MKKVMVFLLLIMIILVVLATAIMGSDGKGKGAINYDPSNPYFQATQSANATATYGAEQFDIQLTAIANKKVNSQAP